MDEIDNVISRNADKTPAKTVKAAWVHAKTKAEKAADKAADSWRPAMTSSPGFRMPSKLWSRHTLPEMVVCPYSPKPAFERPVAVTDGATGVYKFEKLPSFVYLGGSFTAAGPG